LARGFSWRVQAAVPPAQAYDYVADFTRHPEWAMDDMTIKQQSSGPVQAGTKFDAEGILFGRKNPSTVTVTELNPPSSLGFDAQDKQGITHHEFRFTAQDGGTLIEREMTGVKQPWFGPILAIVFRGAINKNFDGALQKLKAMLEAAPKTSTETTAG